LISPEDILSFFFSSLPLHYFIHLCPNEADDWLGWNLIIPTLLLSSRTKGLDKSLFSGHRQIGWARLAVFDTSESTTVDIWDFRTFRLRIRTLNGELGIRTPSLFTSLKPWQKWERGLFWQWPENKLSSRHPAEQ
jgi:hypothetical protein